MEKEAQHQHTSRLYPFDPSKHSGNVAKEFEKFLRLFECKYWAACRKPPAGTEDIAAWENVDKWKQLMGNYATDRFLDDINAATPDPMKMGYTDMTKLLRERYAAPTENTTMAHFKFHRLRQKTDQSFDDFVNEVKKASSYCQFKCAAPTCSVNNTLIRDRIVIGMSDEEFKTKALEEQWDLGKLETQGRKAEAAKAGTQEMKERSSVRVERVSKPGKYSRKTKQKKELEGSRGGGSKPKPKCWYCGRDDCNFRFCPAKKSTCRTCGEKGHWDTGSKCSGNKKAKANYHDISVSTTTSDDEETTESEFSSPEVKKTNALKRKYKAFKVAGSRRIAKVRRKKGYKVQVKINGHEINTTADTGAEINVMTEKTAQNLELKIQKTKMKISPYGAKSFKATGQIVTDTMFGQKTTPTIWYVVKKDVEALLSGETAEELGIITFRDTPPDESDEEAQVNTVKSQEKKNAKYMDKYPNLFKGVGRHKSYEVHFEADTSVKPVAEPPRGVPFHLKNKYEKELEKMEEEGIIEEHHGPAPWVSNVSLAPKDDQEIRVTLDMRNVNKAIKNTHVPIPRAEEIKAQFAGCKHFSKIDFKSAFHQLPLDEESRVFTVFNANGRLMRYARLTQGNNVASGELTKALRPIVANIAHAHIIHDDVVIAAPTVEEHDLAVTKMLEETLEAGLTLNAKKCNFDAKEIKFWGLIVSAEGFRPDPEKVNALSEAEKPKSKEELTSFICMLQANSEFIPNLPRYTTKLRELMKKNAQFIWTSEHEQEFNEVKKQFSEDALLRFYDIKKETFLFVDAHKSGLGAVLSQGSSIENSVPVAVASRTTTKVEKRYPQIDLEGMSVDFGLRRFRQYLVGAPKITVVTDHQPLVPIFARRRLGSLRLDRIKLRHQDINYDLVYRKGKLNPADFLSRHARDLNSLPEEIQDETEEYSKLCWFLHTSPVMEAVTVLKIKEHTKECRTLEKLKKCIKKGEIPKDEEELKQYRRIFMELTISDGGLVMRGEKIVLPESLIKTAISRAHRGGHSGETNLKRRVRSHFWFPGLEAAIREKIDECVPCQLFTDKTTKEPQGVLKVHERAWQQVSLDLYGPLPNNKHIIVAQDTVSKFPAAKLLPNGQIPTVIKALEDIYATYGYPEKHLTDNNPFHSEEFQDYSSSKGIEHQKNFPYHPQANPAERIMKPLGKALKASLLLEEPTAEALREFLVAFRDTPHISTNISPGDYLFRDGYRTEFPSKKPVSQTRVKEAQKKDKKRRTEIQEKVNKSIKRKEDKLKVGDKVLLKNLKRGSKFEPKYLPRLFEVIKVKQKGVVVRGKSGKEYRRHKDDVKQTKLKEKEEREVGSEEKRDKKGRDRARESSRSEMRNPMEQEDQEEQYEEEPQDFQPRRSSRNTRLPARYRHSEMYCSQLQPSIEHPPSSASTGKRSSYYFDCNERTIIMYYLP